MRRALQLIRTAFTPLALLLIAVFTWDSREVLAETLLQAEARSLLLALAFWFLGNFLAPLVASLMSKLCDMSFGYRKAFVIHCGRLPAKYLPGGIWHSVRRADDYLALGSGPARVGRFFVLENFLLITVTLSISAAVVHQTLGPGWLRTVSAYLSPLAVALLLAFPLCARACLRFAAFPLQTYAGVIVVQILYWCLIGASFVSYVAAFPGLELQGSAIETGAIYVFSWCIGYLALFAPQGIGVSEFVAGGLLQHGRFDGTLLAFLLGFRFVALGADLINWGLVLILGRTRALANDP